MKYLLYTTFFLCQLCYGQDTSKMIKLFNQAMEYENKGDLEKAIRTQVELFDLDTTNYPSANIIAGLYGKTGRFTEEIYWATKCTLLNPNYPSGYINLGNGYAGQGDLSKAAHYYKEALRLDSLFPVAWYSLGVVEENKKNLRGAVAYYERSVLADAKFADGYYNLAAAYANLKDFKKANENIVKYLQLNPNDKEAREMYEHIILEILRQ